MPEIGTATVKVVPDLTEFENALGSSSDRNDGARLFFNILSLLLLVCSPAIVWAVYGWAF